MFLTKIRQTIAAFRTPDKAALRRRYDRGWGKDELLEESLPKVQSHEEIHERRANQQTIWIPRSRTSPVQRTSEIPFHKFNSIFGNRIKETIAAFRKSR